LYYSEWGDEERYLEVTADRQVFTFTQGEKNYMFRLDVEKLIWDLKIAVTINGASNYNIVLYLFKDGAVQSQMVATNGKPITLTQKIGESYSILVCKPYMWALSVSGDCTQDTTNPNKIDYAVTSADKTLNLTISGGASTNMVCI